MRLERARTQSPVALIVTPQFLPLLGGMERECALLGEELARRGWEPVILTEQLGMDIPRSERIGDIQVHRVRSSPRRSLVVQLRVAGAFALLILRYRRRARFAIVRTTTLPALLVGALKRLRLVGFPTLVTAETGGQDDDVVALARRPLFALSRALVSANDSLNGICQANVDHLHQYGFPSSKITQIPNGIDISPGATRNAPQRVRRFLFLGRIEPAKGVFELLEAFGELRREHEDVELTFAGDGPSCAELRSRCAESGLGEVVRFAGRVPYGQLGDLFDTNDCLVLPSYSEGMPLSVLEAAAHRRVLIVTDVGDIRRLFGERVHICRPRDAADLAAAMRAVVADPQPAADYGEVLATVAIEAVTDRLLERLGVGSQSPK
jgi:glycosyltransferase involved in cell wall biosynthesis